MMRRAGSIGLLALLVLAACGSASGQSPTTTAPVTTSPSTTTTVTNTSTSTTTSTTTTATATTSTTSTPSTSPTTTATGPAGLTELVKGHNDLGADRINLIFAPWGWDDLDAFRTVLALFVGWDGRAQLIDLDGMPTSRPDQAVRAELGLFGIEPFRSNTSRFNLWVTQRGPEGPTDWLQDETDPFDLPDRSTIVVALDPQTVVPGVKSTAGQDVTFRPGNSSDPVLERTGDDPFANAMLAVNPQSPATAGLDLPHELGHALFGLADEYVGRRHSDQPLRGDFWPSCAASQATAEAWWGDLIGQYDPMIDIWYDEMTAAGFGDRIPDRAYYRQLVTTDFVEDGCFGNPGSVRSAQDTMMGFNTPAYGLTNRQRAEHILELWAGSEP